MQLKPDRLNGQTIYRGVERGPGGINHVNNFILFPPTMTVTPGPVLSLDELTEQALAKIVTVSNETGDPVIKAQALAFRANLKKTLAYWLKRAALNERECCRQHFTAHGFARAIAAPGDHNG
ncbi:MAG: hypothetical protein HOP13_17960 [Alphaproteobacteria bacterium]|nr:hypothetical protein [Alphaproteobacteria bacterium]